YHSTSGTDLSIASFDLSGIAGPDNGSLRSIWSPALLPVPCAKINDPYADIALVVHISEGYY
ncbi:MAG: hypothetical protein K0Q94_6548, partial [Paenibacillus sp.]|nr:hypothetical protein [Paenibacillus sp.]